MSRKSTVAILALVQCGAAAGASPLPMLMPMPVEIVNPQPAASDHFGVNISVSGNRFAVCSVFHDTGGIGDAGAVYLYSMRNGQWSVEAQPVPDDPGVNDQFCAVSLQSGRLVVGASRKASGIGAGYLFERNATGAWAQRQKFQPDSPTSSCGDSAGCHLFGVDVALDGDTAVFSAHTESTRRGAAYVFTRNAQGTWMRTARLTASDATPHSQFGNSVAIDGGTIVVGAQFHPNGSGRGAAYVYTRNPQGVWGEQSRLIDVDGTNSDIFGFSVAVDGDTAVVGAHGRDSRRGAAYVFVRRDGAWNRQTRLLASDGVAGDQFGYSVQISGDDVLVGKYPGVDSGPAADRNGAVYHFRRVGDIWTETEHFTPPSGSAGDGFGVAVARNDRILVAGASREGTPPGEISDRGAVYVYDVSPSDRIFADEFE